MRAFLGQLAPVAHDVGRNLDRIEEVLSDVGTDVAIFPELFLSGYRVGDHIHALALGGDDDPRWSRLRAIARARSTTLIVGAATRSDRRGGETHNAVIAVSPEGTVAIQIKRYLPTYGPFEEGQFFTPTSESHAVAVANHRVGLEICYDTFFPEVSRALAMDGAELIVIISASPVTSRPLFEKLLPARAVENATPVVYVNRVGVEDGVVFGGGSGAWDARGEPILGKAQELLRSAPEERGILVELDLSEAPRWRPFRPVLRDVGVRPSGVPS